MNPKSDRAIGSQGVSYRQFSQRQGGRRPEAPETTGKGPVRDQQAIGGKQKSSRKLLRCNNLLAAGFSMMAMVYRQRGAGRSCLWSLDEPDVCHVSMCVDQGRAKRVELVGVLQPKFSQSGRPSRLACRYGAR